MNQNITQQSIIKRDPSMITSELDDELVMLSVENNEYYGLNAIGKIIWNKIENETTVDTIIQSLMQEYHVSLEQCSAEVIYFLTQISNKKLISIVS